MKKYYRAFQSGFLEQFNARSQLLGRLALFSVIVYLFHQIFESVGASSERLWYYAMTEVIILANSPLVLGVAHDIRSHQMVYFLLRPIDYCSFRVSEAMGSAFFRYVALMLWGVLFVSLLRGSIPVSPFSILLSSLVGILGVFLYTQISLLIGLSSYWVKDVKTLLYLNLTATFCFGGLIVPIVFYPALMQKFCFWTPYPWILWWPSSIFSGGQVDHLRAFGGWCVWTTFFLGINRYVFYRYKSNLVMDGG